MHLLEVPDLLLREGLVPHVDERRAPPEAERRLEDGYLLPRGLRIRLRDQMLESDRVELARFDLEDVAGARRPEHVRPEQMPQARDQVVQRGPRGARNALRPEVVEELVGGDRLARAQEQ